MLNKQIRSSHVDNTTISNTEQWNANTVIDNIN